LNQVANSNGGKAPAGAAGVTLSTPHDAEAKFRIGDTMRRWCFQSLGSRLKAVILTGSLARSEATWRETEHGLQFLSDAEFMIIVQDREEIPSSELLTLICRGAEEELRTQGVLCKISSGAVYESYLSGLGETIFGHELLTCGEVLYGDPDILLSKTRNECCVSEEDAWRLLANRTIELLEIAPELVDGSVPLSQEAQYRLTKLYCDMATSILALKREFVAGYQVRLEKLRHLHGRGALRDLPIDVDTFVSLAGRCTEYKITHSWNGVSPFVGGEAAREAVSVLLALWSWELEQMHGAATASPMVLLHLHMKEQKLRYRVRGWAFVVRRRGLLDSLQNSWRWLRLLRLASPRYCVYAAGLGFWSNLGESRSSFKVQDVNGEKLYGGRLESGNPKLEAARDWLPVANPRADSTSEVEGLAQAILWNYHEFLVETRS